MILLSHPTGNTFSRALLRGLLEAGLLGQFVTCIGVQESGRLLKCLPGGIRRELLRRRFEVPTSLLSTHPVRELCRLAAMKANLRFLTREETSLLSVDAVYQALDRAIARRLPGETKLRHLTGVYCYEDGALSTFQAARKLGLKTYYDLPIAYWKTARNLMREEFERLPEWRGTMVGIQDSDSKLSRKDEELEFADSVFCPSKFVYDSLPANIRENKQCVIVPFGSPSVRPLARRDRTPVKAPLRVLFAGSMSQRKGLADVFSAMKLLKRDDVELVVFGSPVAPLPFYKSQLPGFTHEPPRPHEEVLRLMETCDVLLLPSIVEGRALVQQEALSCGLPLIITPNTGGEDLIEEGKTGFLVPIRSPEAIAEKVDWFACHREELPTMREHAQKKAAELTWPAYATQIIHSIDPQTGGSSCVKGGRHPTLHAANS